jgi:hypothetical protein
VTDVKNWKHYNEEIEYGSKVHIVAFESKSLTPKEVGVVGKVFADCGWTDVARDQ